MKEEKEPQAEPVEPADDSMPAKQKSPRSGNQFTLSDKEVEANEKGAAYPNDGPFGIGMIGRKGK
jgi:hypothetical protein